MNSLDNHEPPTPNPNALSTDPPSPVANQKSHHIRHLPRRSQPPSHGILLLHLRAPKLPPGSGQRLEQLRLRQPEAKRVHRQPGVLAPQLLRPSPRQALQRGFAGGVGAGVGASQVAPLGGDVHDPPRAGLAEEGEEGAEQERGEGDVAGEGFGQVLEGFRMEGIEPRDRGVVDEDVYLLAGEFIFQRGEDGWDRGGRVADVCRDADETRLVRGEGDGERGLQVRSQDRAAVGEEVMGYCLACKGGECSATAADLGVECKIPIPRVAPLRATHRC